MAEYVRFTPEGPWHRVVAVGDGASTACARPLYHYPYDDELSVTPGDYLCKECDRG